MKLPLPVQTSGVGLADLSDLSAPLSPLVEGQRCRGGPSGPALTPCTNMLTETLFDARTVVVPGWAPVGDATEDVRADNLRNHCRMSGFHSLFGLALFARAR